MSSGTDHSSPLPTVRVGEIPLEPEAPRWLLEHLWSRGAVGLIGGSPKSCKSWIGLDMAVSVASGTACLGTYCVAEPGAALIYLAEDALAIVRERVAGIAAHRGLEVRDLDIHAITSPRLRLDREADRNRLFETARARRPRLLLLDPLVRLHSINENDAGEVAQLLAYFREIQRELDVAVVLVHHTRKHIPLGSQAGQGLRGSGDLHAFGDSNAYTRRTRDKLLLTIEHRAAPAPPPVYLELVADDPRTVHLEVRGHAAGEADRDRESLAARILAALEEHRVLSRTQLRDLLAVKNERLGHALKALLEQGRIVRDERGWCRAA